MAAKSKFSFISSSWLKIIAITVMVIDHAAVIFLGDEPSVFRKIGRIAFPIFAFMIAEGARRSKNKLKYALRLLAFAFISEVPFDWGFYGEFLEFSHQNVYFTLFLGLVSVYLFDFFKKRGLGFLSFISTAALGTAAMYLSTDYGFMGVAVITLMAVFNDAKGASRYIGFVLSSLLTVFVVDPTVILGYVSSQVYAVFAAVPISLYNGKRGFKMNKYIFYVFYPAHIVILALIAKIMV
ncbi:MAG: hypothetical protein IKL10_06750 [Clostridia bacterium]|nr:hypothetical protein [Clostridia bacterium]